jgi:cation:H+ antiporter
MIIDILLLLFSILLLWQGSNRLVESASRIAETLGMSELVIGLTIVAFGTSAPEFAVTVSAAVKGLPGISVGNIVGSNIFNLGFILGAVAVVVPVIISPRLVYRDGVLMTASTLLLLFFFRDNTLSMTEGIVLFLVLIIYLVFLFVKKEPVETDEIIKEKATRKDWILLPLGIAIIIAGGQMLVESGSSIARAIGISEWVIGETIIAAGTSAPEMATSLVAVVKGKHGISAGNLIGSNIFNILGVLGIAGIIRPLVILETSYNSLIMLSCMVILAVVLMRTAWRLNRIEGLILVFCGLAMWIYDLIK